MARTHDPRGLAHEPGALCELPRTAPPVQLVTASVAGQSRRVSPGNAPCFPRRPAQPRPVSGGKPAGMRSEALGSSAQPVTAVAIIEGSGYEVGIAHMDMGVRTELHLQHERDAATCSHTLRVLHLLQPQVLLIARSHQRAQKPVVTRVLADMLHREGVDVHAVHRKYFNDQAAATQLAALSYTPLVAREQQAHFLALGAAGALLAFLDSMGYQLTPKALRVVLALQPEQLRLDVHTALALELLGSRQASGALGSFSTEGGLAQALTPCCTKAGARRLRQWLLVPAAHMPTILARQHAIAVLAASQHSVDNARGTLRRLPDVDRVLSDLLCRKVGLEGGDVLARSMHAMRSQLGTAARALQLLRALPTLLAILEGLPASPTLRAIQAALQQPQLAVMSSALTGVLDTQHLPSTLDTSASAGSAGTGAGSGPAASTAARPDDAGSSVPGAASVLQELAAVQVELDGVLDVHRVLLEQHMQRAAEHCAQIAEAWQVPGISVKWTRGRGFALVVPAAMASMLPREAMQLSRTKRAVLCTTQALSVLTLEFHDSMCSAYAAASALLEGTLDMLAVQGAAALQALVDAVALLDVLAALECNAQKFTGGAGQQTAPLTWCMPHIQPRASTLQLVEAWHPALAAAMDKRGQRGQLRTVSMQLGPAQQGAVITGANHTGKSSLLRTAGIVAVLAQLGGPVPASSATVPLYEALVCRGAVGDSMEQNSSHFTTEMLEMRTGLEQVTPSTLVLLDEPGRGTAPLDAAGVVWAISEHSMQRGAQLLLVSHFQELTGLAATYPGSVASWGMECAAAEPGDAPAGNGTEPVLPLAPTFQVANVSTGGSAAGYGIAAAAACGMPAQVVQHARAALAGICGAAAGLAKVDFTGPASEWDAAAYCAAVTARSSAQAQAWKALQAAAEEEDPDLAQVRRMLQRMLYDAAPEADAAPVPGTSASVAGMPSPPSNAAAGTLLGTSEPGLPTFNSITAQCPGPFQIPAVLLQGLSQAHAEPSQGDCGTSVRVQGTGPPEDHAPSSTAAAAPADAAPTPSSSILELLGRTL